MPVASSQQVLHHIARRALIIVATLAGSTLPCRPTQGAQPPAGKEAPHPARNGGDFSAESPSAPTDQTHRGSAHLRGDEPAQATPQPDPAQATPQPDPAQATPQPDPAQATPQRQPVQATPQRQPVQATPQRQPVQATPQALSTQSLPGLPTQLHSRLERVLLEACEDLSLPLATLKIGAMGEGGESEVLRASGDGWTISAELAPESKIRLTAIAPHSRLLRSQTESLVGAELDLVAITLLRAVTTGGAPSAQAASPSALARPKPAPPEPRSSGRALLATQGALIGGFLGFSAEHIGGRGDSRLVFPLLALGAGAGVGASLIVAEEWDIDEGKARYISATGVWPLLAGWLIAEGSYDNANDRRYTFGLLGAGSGLTIGAVALSLGQLQVGGDVVTHSSAMVGGLLGALGQMMAEGNTLVDVGLGTGIGLAGGTVLGAVVAPQLPPLSRSRVLFIDLGVALGGLVGAALASPFAFGKQVTESESRLLVGSVGLGALVGGGLGIALTAEDGVPSPQTARPKLRAALTPSPSFLGIPQRPFPSLALSSQW